MKIALIGAHRKTKLLAPYFDAEWAVWACSPSNESELPRHDAWFELHDPAKVREIGGGVYWQWLRRQPLVWTRDGTEELPGSRAYPFRRMVDRFGPYFFTGSLSWMLALAIDHEPSGIGLWGVSDSPEYAQQRASILHFVQVARDTGIAVTAPDRLLDPPPLYALEEAMNG